MAYKFSTWLFLRSLAVIYLIAFLSLWTQVIGLIGHNGILPAEDYLQLMKFYYHNDAFLKAPTLFWLYPHDVTLNIMCGLGILFSLFLFIGLIPGIALIALLILYLSLTVVGQDFLSFQWDNLLLETGLFAIFLTPIYVWNGFSSVSNPSKFVLFLIRLLLFKLMFLSGAVKLLSGDTAWKDFLALTYHYETQPIPNGVAYFVHFLPVFIHKISCFIMFVIELIIPFFIFGNQIFRLVAFLSLVIFQVLIMLTGNYCFFNLLAITLCLFLIDDNLWIRLLPKVANVKLNEISRFINWHKWIILPIAITAIVINSFIFLNTLRVRDPIMQPIRKFYTLIYPFRLINGYGLFAVMTKRRPEIIIEGSNDGKSWREYEFHFKPGNLKRIPPFVALHQPRLDWQMWFAALSNYRQSTWFVNFAIRLLEGSEEVVSLIKRNPFPKNPPRFIRAVLYEYKFASFSHRSKTGNWWRREKISLYLPVVELNKTQMKK